MTRIKRQAKNTIIIVGLFVAYLAVTNNQTNQRRLRGFQFNIADYKTTTINIETK